MADLARLGFAVATGDLADAKTKLDALVPSAQRAERATDKFNNAAAGITRNAKGAATGIMSFDSAVDQAAAGVSGMAAGALRASTAMGTVQAAAVGAASAIQVVGMAGKQYGPSTAMWEAYRASLQKIPAAASNARDSLQRLGAAANDNINRMQATPGNIAAQFQDIGVTAAGGMQPYLIALQQGTQLSAAMQGGLGNLAAAFGQMLSPVSLLTIAMVGWVAVLIQQINWYEAAKNGLNLVADAMDAVTPYAFALFTVLRTVFGPAIIAYITLMAKTIAVALYNAMMKVAVAMYVWAAANPFTALLAAVQVLTFALIYFGVVTAESVKKPINAMVGGFVGAFNAVKKTWSMLPSAIGDAAIQAANVVISTIDQMVNSGIEKINGLLSGLPAWLGGGNNTITFRANSGQLGNQYAGKLGEVSAIATGEIKNARSKDWVGKSVSFIEDGIGYLADKIRGFADGIGPETKDKKNKGKTDKAASGSDAKTEAEKQAEAFDKLRLSTEAYTRSKAAETAAVSLGAREAATLKHQTDLTNQAIQQGIPLDDARKSSIQGWAQAMADADMKLANATGWKKLQDQMSATTTDMADQRAQLGMTAEQTSRYKWEVIWLRDAIKNLQDATPEQIAQLTEWARKMGDAEASTQQMREQIERTREAMNFAKDGVKGFVADLKGGLEQGKNFFSAFADSVLNVLNKVLDKLVDVAINAAFDNGASGGVGGFLDGVIKAFGGGSKTPGIARAALGTVVSGRSFIDHAAGRTMIAENGPEAVMPLKRGADGSLGVAVNDNSRQRGPLQAPSVSITNHYQISGASTADMQREVRRSAEAQRDQLRREVPQILAEYQSDGAIVS